ncbi:MAG: ATP-dependent RecD-like DNA helicase [Deltaproteobacteria bacterium]|nr:MAG: ATP-dependent RecD-like DNA helicase [Deltaproteobacteria bacterium]
MQAKGENQRGQKSLQGSLHLEGQVERITFSSPETGYTVARLKVEGYPLSVTIVGNLPNITTGQTIRLTGLWENHPKFGRQFRVQSYQRVMPKGIEAIKKYLGSGLIEGIGPVLAERIVDMFGEETLSVIDERIDELAKVEGIGQKRLELIKDAWKEQKEVSSLMLFLKSHDLGLSLATKIIKRYGKGALSIITENPYRLARDIPGIGFKTADRVATSLGFEHNCIQRLEAGVLFSLSMRAEQGHVFYPYRALLLSCAKLLGTSQQEISRAIASLVAKDEIVIEDLNEDLDAFEPDKKAVFLRRYHMAETGIARHMARILQAPASGPLIDAPKAVQWLRQSMGLTFAPKQLEAIQKALESKALIITGGPGTGKTTAVKGIIQIFQAKKTRVLLAAPTGRASKRMQEATAMEAKTIHRLLEFSWEKGGFQRNENRPLEADVIIVDEVSMVDVSLMAHLLKAIPSHARLILVGDVDQLPSVGPGNVLRDMIHSGKIPVVTLTEIFRQAKQSLITVNAHRINQGLMPQSERSSEGLQDFYFIAQEDPEQALEVVLELACKRVPKRFSLDPLRDVQVLTPMHRGNLGTGVLNQRLQELLNPKAHGVRIGSHVYGPGDKVMQIRNDYEKEVFNGDIGFILSIDQTTGEMTVNYEERQVTYRFSELDDITLAYAISVHKSQGSEYPAVILPLLTQHYLLLQRNLLYTAVTRARKLLVMVGSKKALAMAISNQEPRRRFTLLAQRLREL